jgi:hypothetical protein
MDNEQEEAVESQWPTIKHIPDHCFSFASGRDLVRLALTCKHFQIMILKSTTHRTIWESKGSISWVCGRGCSYSLYLQGRRWIQDSKLFYNFSTYVLPHIHTPHILVESGVMEISGRDYKQIYHMCIPLVGVTNAKEEWSSHFNTPEVVLPECTKDALIYAQLEDSCFKVKVLHLILLLLQMVFQENDHQISSIVKCQRTSPPEHEDFPEITGITMLKNVEQIISLLDGKPYCTWSCQNGTLFVEGIVILNKTKVSDFTATYMNKYIGDFWKVTETSISL